MPKNRAPRSIRLEIPPDKTGTGVFCLRQDTQLHFYVFREIPCEIGGRGFVVHRLGLGTPYHVRVGEAAECSCECLGFLRHGACKHVLGMHALLRNKLI